MEEEGATVWERANLLVKTLKMYARVPEAEQLRSRSLAASISLPGGGGEGRAQKLTGRRLRSITLSLRCRVRNERLDRASGSACLAVV